jgi:hypothetical protein
VSYATRRLSGNDDMARRLDSRERELEGHLH